MHFHWHNHARLRAVLRRVLDWMGHRTLIDTAWGHRVLRQIYREREFDDR